jgi:hypothetical protein
MICGAAACINAPARVELSPEGLNSEDEQAEERQYLYFSFDQMNDEGKSIVVKTTE